MAQVLLKQVEKTYDKQAVVKELQLTIPDGSFTVLLGPSGCGKSTTLRMIAGLESATKGEIWIGNTRVNELPPGKRDIAMVFQNYALYPTMSVYNNIAFGLRNRGVSRTETKKLVHEIAEIVQLSPYLDRKPSQLSGGQRQRVALARAMVKKPQVFLMDEPLSNLDAKLRNQMRTELTDLHKQLGTTFIYVTHDQVEAMTMGDQIVVMNNGQIQQVASPLDMYRDPANLFVAQFIGSPPMNILFADDEKPFVMGFRPEKAVIKSGGSQARAALAGQPQDYHMRGEIASREILGSETLYHITTPQGRVTVKTTSDQLHEIGKAVSLTISKADLHFFEKRTTARINGDHSGILDSLQTGVLV
ncbi:UNVERIFIED_CONTAM: sn-glycerol 3-phosphate transport system ATP-binding protein [Brevibacillus sp. OAP136]